MKSFISKKHLALILLLSNVGFVITSCEKDSPLTSLPYDLNRGVAISNEGAFGTGNASLSIYYPDGDSIVNDIFTKVNNRPLGDVFQSIGFAGNNAYMIMNASNKIEVVDKSTCGEIATISDIGSPRYFCAINSQKAYVTLWGNGGKVGVIDLATNSLTKQIAVGVGPEKIIMFNQKVFVANSGGWGTDNRVSVINPISDEVTATITVGDNPKDFVVDANGKLWVLCAGNVVYGGDYSITSQTSGKLMMINPSTNLVEKTIDLGETYHPSHLEIYSANDILYYGGDFATPGIFSILITATEKSSAPLINENFYGFNIDPVNGLIYGLQAPSFTTSGALKRFTPSGELIGSFTVGVGPNGAYFAD
jgi:YVTN family beta-propeller protein